MSVEQLENKWHGLVTHATNEPGVPLVVDEVQPNSPAAAGGLRAGRRDLAQSARCRTVRPLDSERALLDRSSGEKIAAGRASATGERTDVRRCELAQLLDSAWDVLGWNLIEEPKGDVPEAELALSRRHAGGGRAARQPGRRRRHPPGDILVGMHGWETASAQDIDYIVTRPNLAEMGAMKFYVLRGKSMLYGHMNVGRPPSPPTASATSTAVSSPLSHGRLSAVAARSTVEAWKRSSSVGCASMCRHTRTLPLGLGDDAAILAADRLVRCRA